MATTSCQLQPQASQSSVAEAGGSHKKTRSASDMLLEMTLKGDVTLRLKNYPDALDLRMHSSILRMCSPVLDGLFEASGHTVIKELELEGTPDAWRQLLVYLYPQLTPPPLTTGIVWTILETVHRYNIEHVLRGCDAYLSSPSFSLSSRKSSASYVLKWLELSERLQMDALFAKCLAFLKKPANIPGPGPAACDYCGSTRCCCYCRTCSSKPGVTSINPNPQAVQYPRRTCKCPKQDMSKVFSNMVMAAAEESGLTVFDAQYRAVMEDKEGLARLSHHTLLQLLQL